MSDYRDIYLRNIYEVELPAGTLFHFSLSDFDDASFFDRSFAIITANNPYNRPLSNEENRARNRSLYNELNSNWHTLRAKGSLDEHSEEGYLVYGIPLSEAIGIALRYGQYALFYNTTETLEYIECKNGKVIVSKRR